MLQTKADVSKDILENITLGRFIRENRVEKNQDGMKWHAFKVGKFFMKHPVSDLIILKNGSSTAKCRRDGKNRC